MDYGIAAKQLINLYILSHHTDVSTVYTTACIYSAVLFCRWIRSRAPFPQRRPSSTLRSGTTR